MRNVPEHVLNYQQGGVAPIQAPLMEQQNMAPLIQVASMPVDVGVETALRLRQQQIQRDQLALHEDELAWRKEAWKSEFDLKTQQNKAFNSLKLIEIFDGLMGDQMSTGVSKSAASQYGLPTNFHTAAQQKALQDVHVAKVERISEFMSAIKGDLANIDPEQYYKLRADLSKVEGDAYRKAFEQATYHQQQIDTFKKTPEDYDAELFSMGMLNYSGSDVNQKYDMLHPSLKKMKETIWNTKKEEWGLPQMMDMGDGIRQIFQTSRDRRQEFANDVIQNYSRTIHAKWELQRKLAADGVAPDPGDYETYATNYAGMLAESLQSHDVKLGSTPKIDTEAANGDAANSPLYTPEATVQNWVGAVDAVPTMAIEAKNVFNPFKNSEEYSSKLIGVTGFGSDLSIQPSDLPGSQPLTPEMKTTLQIAVNAVTGSNTDVPLDKYLTSDNILTKDGKQALEKFAEKASERINTGIIVTSFPDIKDDGVFSTATSNESVVKQFYDQLGAQQLINIATGEMLTGQDLKHRYFKDYDSSESKMREATSIPGIIDPRNILPMVAKQGNQIVQNASVFGAAPYYMEFTTPEGEVIQFAAKREDTWLQSAAGQRYKGGNSLYNNAVSGVGTKVPVDQTAVIQSMTGYPVPIETISRIQRNLSGVRLGKYEGAQGPIDTTVIEYGEDSTKTATGKLEIVEPYSAGKGIIFMDALSKGVGAGHTVNITQGRDPSTGIMGYVVKVDDQKPFVLVDDNQHAELNLQKIQQAVIDADGDGREDGSANFKNAIIGTDNQGRRIDMNLSKQFNQDWATTMDPILPNGYKITSAFRMGDPTAGKGRTIDLTGHDKDLNEWFMTNVPGLKKVSGTETSYHRIPNTPFAVTWHQNMNLIRDAAGNVIKKVPTVGHHFDIKYANEVTLQ